VPASQPLDEHNTAPKKVVYFTSPQCLMAAKRATSMIVVWCLFVHFIWRERVFVVWGESSSPDDWQDSLKDIWCRSHWHEVSSQ